jgi:hypothetical protein
MSEPLSNQSEIIANYASGPDRLEAAITGLSDGELDMALSDDSWTIRQIVHHVTDGDDIWKQFIKRAIGNPEGEFTLQWYWEIPQDEWVKLWVYEERAIEPSLALFRANRAHIVQLLEHATDPWEKSLSIRWPNGETQEISVGWVVGIQAQHVEGHLDDMRRIREAHGFVQE